MMYGGGNDDQNYSGHGGYQGDGSYDAQYGYNYRNYRPNDSLKGKVEQKYWKTKQKVIEKLGKNQDEFVIAGDAEVDARLEAFKHIQLTCMQLMTAIELYQNRIFALSQDENEMGRFLRDQGSQDKTKAGKMMIAVGKAQSYAAQQRLSLRVPLVRLYQEIETFRFRAISDTGVTVQRMETSRSEYRAGMLWMADVSKELDPDVNKRLDRFRDVQAQVKSNKKQFDKLKVDVVQKIDLLSASRCNLLSATLAAYQTTMLKFLEQTAKSYQMVSQQFKGHPSYQFQVLKHIMPNNGIIDSDEEDVDNIDNSKGKRRQSAELATEAGDERLANHVPQDPNRSKDDDSKLISFDMSPVEEQEPTDKASSKQNTHSIDDKNLLEITDDSIEASSPGFGDFETSNNAEDGEKERQEFEKLLNNFKQPVSSFSREDNAASAYSSNSVSNADLLGGISTGPTQSSGNAASAGSSKTVDDLLFGSPLHGQQSQANDLDLLNDILSSASLGDGTTETGEASFSTQWQAMFGTSQPPEMNTNSNSNVMPTPNGTETTTQSSGLYMPSFLMDQMRKVDPVAAEKGAPTSMGSVLKKASLTPNSKRKAMDTAASKKQQDMSAWFNLFSDLDPLSNPDAVGKDRKTDDERSC